MIKKLKKTFLMKSLDPLPDMATKENSTPNSTLKPITKSVINNSTSNNVNTKPYGKILLTLQNCLLSEDKLNKTPSSVDGLDAETEADLRILGCELIQIAGILLRLPQVN